MLITFTGKIKKYIVRQLRRALNFLKAQSKKWKIQVNAETYVIEKNVKNNDQYYLSTDSHPVETTTKVTWNYEQMTWNPHQKYAIGKATGNHHWQS